MERRFPLQPVLNYRQSREDALQLELAKLLADEQAARMRLDGLRQEWESAANAVRALQSESRPDVGAIQQGFVYLGAVDLAIADQVEVVAAATERTEAKRREVVVAMQDRKILEKLRQRHERTYAEWVRRVEARAVDDIVTVRYARRIAAEVEPGR